MDHLTRVAVRRIERGTAAPTVVFGRAMRAPDGANSAQRLTTSIRLRYTAWLKAQKLRGAAVDQAARAAPAFSLGVLREMLEASDARREGDGGSVSRSAQLIDPERLRGCHPALAASDISVARTVDSPLLKGLRRPSSPTPTHRKGRRRPGSPTLEDELAALESTRSSSSSSSAPTLARRESNSIEIEIAQLLATGVRHESVHCLLFAAKALLCLAEGRSDVLISSSAVAALRAVRIPTRPALRATLDRMRRDEFVDRLCIPVEIRPLASRLGCSSSPSAGGSGGAGSGGGGAAGGQPERDWDIAITPIRRAAGRRRTRGNSFNDDRGLESGGALILCTADISCESCSPFDSLPLTSLYN